MKSINEYGKAKILEDFLIRIDVLTSTAFRNHSLIYYDILPEIFKMHLLFSTLKSLSLSLSLSLSHTHTHTHPRVRAHYLFYIDEG